MNRPLSAETRSINGITVEPITPAERAQIDTNTGNIATNTSNIATNTSDIATANSNISTNTSDIATANSNIATNTSDIATNSTDIATNVVAISNKQDTLTTSSNISINEGTFKNVDIDCDSDPFPGALYIIHDNLNPQPNFRTSIFVRKEVQGSPYMICCPLSTATPNAANTGTLGTDYDFRITSSGGIESAGNIVGKRFLGIISGSSVGGTAFYRFEGNSGQINMNTAGGVDVPWTATYVDTTTFTQPSSTQIRVVSTGYYEVGFNIYLTSTVQRANPTIRIRVNGNDTGFLAWGYLRGQSNVNESHWSLSPVMLYLAANDILSVQGRFTTQGTAGGAYLYKNASSTNTAFPSLMIKRIA